MLQWSGRGQPVDPQFRGIGGPPLQAKTNPYPVNSPFDLNNPFKATGVFEYTGIQNAARYMVYAAIAIPAQCNIIEVDVNPKSVNCTFENFGNGNNTLGTGYNSPDWYGMSITDTPRALPQFTVEDFDYRALQSSSPQRAYAPLESNPFIGTWLFSKTNADSSFQFGVSGRLFRGVTLGARFKADGPALTQIGYFPEYIVRAWYNENAPFGRYR